MYKIPFERYQGNLIALRRIVQELDGRIRFIKFKTGQEMPSLQKALDKGKVELAKAERFRHQQEKRKKKARKQCRSQQPQ